jgi:PIF1-like helicase
MAWSNRQYIIIDEVSMMDCNVLSRLHTQLSLLKSRPEDLFGAVNIIFLGDFLQFPAVSHMDVYLNNERCQSGYRLWRSLNAVVILKKQMRQANDSEYGSLLSRIRTRSPTDADIDRLNSRIGAVLPNMSSLPVIVRRHSVRHAINAERLQQYADILNYDVTHCIALIRQRVDVTIQEAYQCKYGELGMEGDAVLALAPGVPLLITKNISQSLGMLLYHFFDFYLSC